ncbi:MAG: hypothetical protein ACTSUK_10440 [Promethearchaeota archaeon]
MGFDYANDPKETYPIIKWDIIVNILFFSAWMWFKGNLIFQIVAVFLFLQAYIVSYYIFHYYKYDIPIVLVLISIFLWLIFFVLNSLLGEVYNTFLFICIAFTIYAVFSFVIRSKNYKAYLKANGPQPCPICGMEKWEHVFHLGQDMCRDCFEKRALSQVYYHDSLIFQWDYDVLMFIEKELGKEIPALDPVLNYTNPTQINPDELFGFVLEDRNITRLYLNNQKLRHLPPFIGLLIDLRELHLKNNKLASLPSSIFDLVRLRLLDYRQNPIKFRTGEIERALLNLMKRGCEILED